MSMVFHRELSVPSSVKGVVSHASAYFVLLLTAFSYAHGQTADPNYIYPLIENHGGIVALPKAQQKPEKESKVVIDITSDEMSGGVIKGLDRAALILNQYAHAGAGPQEGFRMAVVLHGKATKAALTDAAYRNQVGGEGNPNLALIQRLKSLGIDIYVCGQALAHNNYAMESVTQSVVVAESAASANINKQLEGYAYLPFH